MHVRLLFIVIALIAIVVGCTASDETKEFAQVRTVVWEYIANEGWDHPPLSYTKEMWDRATVKKEMSDKFEFISEIYEGEEIYTVSQEDWIASPTFFVDQDLTRVVYLMEGM